MKKNLHLLTIAGIFITIFMIACATQSAFQTYMTIDSEFTSLVNQYEIYYRAAAPEIQEKWKQNIDPLILRGNQLMDQYYDIVLLEGDTTAIMHSINALKSQILLEIAKDME